MIRLLRILRIFRIVRFLKELYMLVVGFGLAAVATGWVALLAIILVYVCGIVTVKLCKEVDDDDPSKHVLVVGFPDVPTAMVTLFNLMLSPSLHSFDIGQMFRTQAGFAVFLCLFAVFGGFGMIALLTGVISESMFEKNQVRLEEERFEREEKRKILNTLCSDFFDEIVQAQLQLEGQEDDNDQDRELG